MRERWLAEDQIRFLALHDSLTGLPNRLQLSQHLDRAVSRAKRHGHLMAVFGLDLDRFKDVNDTLGHATGDALL
ncbi:diguanylate cyclase domain-containing protein, partial [Methyloceanibacter sp.]|uniref:diguanylate cyclase domain-containing protein n=1 Tax=Methyloceanibacter sp. TaxID=1965321 RepID=UPI00351ABC66